MAISKKVFTLRLQDDIFEKIEYLAELDYRSITNLIEYILLQHVRDYEKEHGPIIIKKD